MTAKFSKKTFQYFELAQKNQNNRNWFEKNKDLYLEHVRAPFEALVLELGKHFRKDLPGIQIDPKSVTRPLRQAHRARGEGLVKNFSHITLWEKRSSLFEWNPGIHVQFGAKADDNFVGLGLYMISSRQMSLLRNALVDDFEEIDAILSNRALKKAWGDLKGDRYKRFPKGFSAEDPRTKYLWFKQFYLGQEYSRSEVVAKDFTKNLVKDLKLAIPFFKWVRQSVGTYQRRGDM